MTYDDHNAFWKIIISQEIILYYENDAAHGDRFMCMQRNRRKTQSKQHRGNERGGLGKPLGRSQIGYLLALTRHNAKI